VETAPEEGRGRDDGSGGSVAAGSRHAQGEEKSPRRKRDQWDTKGGKGKSATERRGSPNEELKRTKTYLVLGITNKPKIRGLPF
jgi:hypothetical protein